MATADIPKPDVTDSENLLPLLREYSGKLRERSERIMLAVAQSKSQRHPLLLAALVGGCTAVVVVGLILQPMSWSNPQNLIAPMAAMAASIYAVVTTRERRTLQDHLRSLVGGNHSLSPEEFSVHVRNVKILTEQVGKLISRVSQLEDHHAREFNDRIELELRLTEAEGAVTFVNEVLLPAVEFQTKRSSDTKTGS